MPLMHRGLVLALTWALTLAAAPLQASDPIIVTPHPHAGKFRLKHDPDKPLLGFYGGIGLRKLDDGRWTGYGQTSPKDVEYLIQRCRENGIKRIYGSFQEERYPSAVAPAKSGTSEIDYVALVIKLAHENNIQVYADQPTFANVLERNHAFVEKHRHVFGRSASGEPDTHMLSPAWPEVRRHKRAIFMEWVQNYPIDGIQLDFIRFPFYGRNIRVGYGQHGYDEPTLKAFRAKYALPADYQPKPEDQRWIAMKAELVSQFIRELRGDLKASGIDLPIGVYNSGIFGRADSLRTVHQDWAAWEKQGLVNEHSPMFLMSNGMTNLAGAVKSLIAVKRPESRIIGPLFLAEGYMPGERPTPADVRDAARRLIKLGCDELWTCRANELEEFDLWPVMKEISQWSIAEIRAQDFDPAYENLLKNGDFESGTDGWTASTPDAAKVATSPAPNNSNALTLSNGTLSQTLKFRPLSFLPVDTLTFAARVRATSAAPTLAIHVSYLDGTSETQRFPLSAPAGTWSRPAAEMKLKTDFAKLVATQAEFVIESPDGSIELDDIEVQRDLLIDRGGTLRVK